MRRTASLTLAAVLALVPLAGCGSSDSDGAAPEASTTISSAPSTSGADGPATTTSAAAAVDAPLEILVSNDDGYQAEGIDTLVEALVGLDGVEVTVVAPLDQQSGQGGNATEGELAVTDVMLASGHPAKAVDGFPADTIRVAIDELGLTPDVVITGINEGQNLGPFVDVSGTVGAARAAVARGVPALAASQGSGEPLDYAAAVEPILDWVTEHRAALADGSAAVEVANLNVPTCATGEVRGLAEVPADATADAGTALADQDCTDVTPLADLDTDVAAFVAGYATLSTVPAEPAG